jgi:hypothetical protein
MSLPNTDPPDLAGAMLALLAEHAAQPQDAAMALATVLGTVIERNKLSRRAAHAVLDIAIDESAALRMAA